MSAMFSLKDATPFIYSNVGLFGAFVCSPLLVATALSVEVLSFAITGTSAFSQKQQLAKTEPAPAPELRNAPALLTIVTASVEPSATVVAAARGIDDATGSKSPNSGSLSTCDSLLLDDKKDTDDEVLAGMLKMAWSDEDDCAAESGSEGSEILADGEVVVVVQLQLQQLERVVGQFAELLAAPLSAPAKPVSRPEFSKALVPRISQPLPALNTVSASVSASVAKEIEKPKVAPTSANATPKPASAAKVTIPAVVARFLKTDSPLRTSTPATPRTSAPLTSPARPSKFKPNSPARVALLAKQRVVPSPTEPSTSRTRDAPLPPTPAARPAAPSVAKPSPPPAPFSSTAKLSPTPIFPSKVAPAPTPELTPPPTPAPRRKPASPFGAPRLASSTPSSSTSPPTPASSAPSPAPVPLRREEAKPASPLPTTASPFTFKPFADLSAAIPPRPLPTPTSSTSHIKDSALLIPSTSSLLPSLPIASPIAAKDKPKLEGLESSIWAYEGYKEKVNAGVQAFKAKHAAANAVYYAEQLAYHDKLMSSPLGAVVKPPTVPAYMLNKGMYDNFIEKEGSGSGSNPPTVATKSAKMVDYSSDEDSDDDESVEDNTPRVIRPLRRSALAAVSGSQLSFNATPVASAPCAPVPATVPFPQSESASMAVDVGSTCVAETTMVVEQPSVIETDSTGFDYCWQESYMDDQPESSNPDRSYLSSSSYNYSSFPPTTRSSFAVNSPFGDCPTTPLANLHSTAGFASFASSYPPSPFQPSSTLSSYAAPPVQSGTSFTTPQRDYSDIDARFAEDAELFAEVAPYYASPTSTLPPLPPTLPRTPTPIAPSSSAPRAFNSPLPFPSTPPPTAGPSSSRHSLNMAIIDEIEAEEEKKKEKERSVAKNLLKMLDERRRASVRTYEDIEA
ncbi:hypothetical protein RQP46_003690 [Phenoliferia psychrophenolica]